MFTERSPNVPWQGILHGDVKSANVLLALEPEGGGAEGRGQLMAKLCDFGSAERVGAEGLSRRKIPGAETRTSSDTLFAC
jgi:serine/threonine protein kinase